MCKREHRIHWIKVNGGWLGEYSLCNIFITDNGDYYLGLKDIADLNNKNKYRRFADLKELICNIDTYQ